MGRQFNLSFLIVFLLIFLWGCRNPFFPPTGVPTDVSRGTPEEVIKQLKKSYERRRIDLFEDVLYSKEEFRFYIEQNEKIIDSLQKINPEQREKVNIDYELSEDFIADDFLYVYLTYNEEMDIHRNLFREAEQITFSSFEPYEVEYFATAKEVGDSIVYDTLDAVAYTDETKITISSKKLTSVFGEKEHAFPVGKQVFLMKKDSEGLWKIIYWFERRRK